MNESPLLNHSFCNLCRSFNIIGIATVVIIRVVEFEGIAVDWVTIVINRSATAHAATGVWRIWH
jgi:hypothetical protein